MVAFNYGDYRKLDYCNKYGALSPTTNIDGSLSLLDYKKRVCWPRKSQVFYSPYFCTCYKFYQ